MKRLFMSVMLIAGAGCIAQVEVEATELNPRPRQAYVRPAAQVEVYTIAPPSRPYVEVALLRASGPAEDDHYGPLRREAGRLGCDAVVIAGVPTVVATTSSSSSGVNDSDNRASTTEGDAKAKTTVLTATCVMWAEATTPPASPPGGPPGATQ